MSSFEEWKQRKKEEYDARWEAQEEILEEMKKGEDYEVDEKGLIKRDGFSMHKGAVNYGYQFEKEHFDEVFKKGMIFIAGFFVLTIVIFVLVVYFIVAHPENPIWIQTLFQK